MTKVLIVSNGPVPPMQDVKIEGGGQRAWGLAIGLASHGHSVTVAVPFDYPIRSGTPTSEGISLVNWSSSDDLAKLANDLGIIIISYSLGRKAARTLSKLRDDVKVILDCYVPIYIEVSARKTDGLNRSFANYQVDLGYYNSNLRRGDYFLCANKAQGQFYDGVLSALGVINPASYEDDRMLLVPSGIDKTPPVQNNNPYDQLGIARNNFVLLWFGGLYPWFDISVLLQVIKELGSKEKIHLVIVGGKNPYNKDSSIQKQYHYAKSFVEENKLLDSYVHFVDWVDYDERGSWYAHAGAVINLNQQGQENTYSWRTRLMDFIWGEAPILTNGGDPLSEELIAHGAAIKLEFDNSKQLANSLASLIKDKKQLARTKKNLTVIKPNYYWQNVVIPLHEKILEPALPFQQQKNLRNKLWLNILKAKFYSTRLGSLVMVVPRKIKGWLK